ncbi:hypothetical protein C5748_07030 [Phyllobacterium phragmitis]|uniref:Uncharacterized protein n=1 Tax=Phyllobacterium phragmitis TaxID=2670329 RepID=A0A2S9IUX5_9HYPH|nr:hypothetical protein [Phyllobacterium phragmitis]PRD44334.1 hypothetical protein C5748_07030 [Phyllobacterium phragmitis]
MSQPVPEISAYQPRAAWFDGLVDCGPASIKLSLIEADPAKPIAPAAIDKARALIEAAGGKLAQTRHLGAGFAILHQGQEGLWLLLHWWIEGDIATQMLWRSKLGGDADFIPAEPLLMACVWELAIIDFERRAWMDTAMSGKSITDYLTRTMPRGTV